MAKFNSKSTGNTLTAVEYNDVQLPRQDVLDTSGITGVSTDNTQLSKAIANYSAISNFYTDSGAADAYVLTVINSFRSPTAYVDGLEVRFRAGNANTGASTINVAGLGVKNIKQADGTTDIIAGAISPSYDSSLRYDLANDVMILTDRDINKLPGDVVQVVEFATGLVSTGTTTIPGDNTIPQNTEGDEYLSKQVTFTSATNKYRVDVEAILSHSAATTMQAAIFQDSTVGALASCTQYQAAVTGTMTVNFSTKLTTTGTVSPTTFKVRAGGIAAGTTTFNGSNSVQIHGGVLSSKIVITEIKV